MNWRDRAACARIGGDAWFPEVGMSPAAAKAVCATCPVVAECLEHALSAPEKFGIWGGLSETQRRSLRRSRAA
jgi:WhiB family redox-sensing transcriptional regulator